MRRLVQDFAFAGMFACAATAAHADVVISSAATQNVSCSNGVCTPTATDAVLNVGDLETLLASGNVEVTTTGSGMQADNVSVDAALTWSSSSALTLDAYDSISVKQPVTPSSGGGLSVVTNDGDSGGTFSFGPKGHVTFPGTSNVLSINGTTYTLVANLPALAGAIAANPSGSYALVANYDAHKDGTYKTSPITTTFEGNFNGLGNTIANLEIDDKSRQKAAEYVALFSELDTPSSVSSLRMSGAYVQADGGSKEGLVVGGLVAANYGTVFNSSVAGTLHVVTRYVVDFGGVAGFSFGTLDQVASYATVEVISNGYDSALVGGVAGISEGIVEQSYATGSVIASGTSGAGGVGGLLGSSDGTVENCYATGSAAGEGAGDNYDVGGLIGTNFITSVTSYSTGKPTAGSNSYVGGLIGDDGSANGDIQNAYWDTTTSGITNLSQGAGNIANDPGITGETTKLLKSGLPTGFDSTIWAEDKKINNGLPYLINNPPPK